MLSHLKFTVSMGDYWYLFWRGGENIPFLGFRPASLFFLLLLSFLEKRWSHPWGLDSSNSVWQLDTTEPLLGVVSLNFFSQTSEFIQVSFHSSLFPLLFFRRSSVSLPLTTKANFSTFVLHPSLELDSFNYFFSELRPLCFPFRWLFPCSTCTCAAVPYHQRKPRRRLFSLPHSLTCGIPRTLCLHSPHPWFLLFFITASAQAVRDPPAAVLFTSSSVPLVALEY